MKLFAAGFDVILMRYFLTMFIAVGSFMVGLPWLALLCLPTFLLALTAVKFDLGSQQEAMRGRIDHTSGASKGEAA